MKRMMLAMTLGAMGWLTVGLFADDKAVQGQPSDDEMAQYMAQFMKLATPNENHARLESMVGRWKATGKFRMTPDAPWTEHKSTAETTWMLGKRFLETRITGEPMFGSPVPFEGFGLMGFDNQSQKYISVWADNMGTMMMTAEGTASDDGKTLTFRSEYTDPMTGAKTWMKSVYEIGSKDHYVLKMYSPSPAGDEFLTMEITNQRG